MQVNNGSPRALQILLYPVFNFLILCIAPGTFQGADASQDAGESLERMVNAAQTLNYDGVFVYQNGEQMETMRIIHRVDASGEHERLVALTGVAREVLRDKSRVTCILPDDESVVVGKSRPNPAIFAADGGWNKYYTLSVAGGDRVAGRPTEIVVVKPKDRYRYGYRLGLDRETGLLLKSELVDEQGVPLEKIVFTSISLPKHIPDELLEPGISGKGFRWVINEAKPRPTDELGNREEGRWHAGWLPQGFDLSGRASGPTTTSLEPVEHLVYTDGLASLSVYIEHLEPNTERLEGLSSMGAVNAYGALIKGYHITVVGEVPQITVELVGRSIVRESLVVGSPVRGAP